MGYAFISYSTKNQADADALKALLAKKGIRSWMAPGDIPVGSKYAQVINRAIKECACFVLLLTDAAQSSPWVAKEVERAVNYGKTILPIKMENIVLNEEFEFYISTDQIVAVQKIDEHCDGMQHVLRSILALIGEEETPSAYTSVFSQKKRRAAQIFAWILFALAYCGLVSVLAAATDLFSLSIELLFLIGTLTLSSICGAAFIYKDIKRINKYSPLFLINRIYSIDEIAQKSGVPFGQVKREINRLINRNYMQGVYIDHQTDDVIIINHAAPLPKRLILSGILRALSIMYGLIGLIDFIFFPENPYMLISWGTLCFTFNYTAISIQKYSAVKTTLYTLVQQENHRDISILAAKAGITVKQAKKRIQSMIIHNILKNAYIDEQTQSVVFTTQ